jgi:hypothetical protein
MKEGIYDFPGGKDPEDVVASILKLNPQQVIEKEKEIIGDWPNTYTFTKGLAERTL